MKITPDTPFLNRHFKVVFKPKRPKDYGGRKRFFIGIYQLHKYIGEKNAENVILKALNSQEDRYKKAFRTKGKVYFYIK